MSFFFQKLEYLSQVVLFELWQDIDYFIILFYYVWLLFQGFLIFLHNLYVLNAIFELTMLYSVPIVIIKIKYTTCLQKSFNYTETITGLNRNKF